jgi:two-component system cell cycle sensor histidine kinase/response regulator CckA
LKKEGVLSDVNPAWLNQLGYKKENVIGKPFKDLLHPESQINFQERFPQFKANGSISEIEFKIRHHYMSSNSQ